MTGETMPTPVQVLVGLGIFFFLLWAPLVVVFMTSKMRGQQVPPRDDRRT
jgi:hypothetical protein